MNVILESIYRRKSIRMFDEKPISSEDKAAILRSAIEAPSPGNQQMYTILDITDQQLKDRLVHSCDSQPFIAKAPLVLIFCADMKKWYDAFVDAHCAPRELGVGDLMLATVDASIAAQNTVIAAEALGLGSCYIGDILENCELHREILQLPEHVFPATMVVYGYATEQQRERPKPSRGDIKHIVHENTYRQMDGNELREMLQHKAGQKPYEEWLQAFCARKYNSEFSREMTRSVAQYLQAYKTSEK